MTASRKTFCRICEAHCGLIVERQADGRLTKIRPDSSHPISAGFVCAKGLLFLEIADHPQRLLQPQIRQPDGSWQPAAWEAAYALIGDRLRAIVARHGVHAVAVYFGTPMIHNALLMVALYQWIRAVGTRNLYSAASQDNASKLAAQKLIHGREWLMPIPDIEHADFALLMGTNPVVSQGTLIHMRGGVNAYDAFIKRGGKMAIVDPRRSESAKRWGGHIPIKPGTDVFLLLAILRELRHLRPENDVNGLDALLDLAKAYPAGRAAALTGIPADQIQSLAEQLRAAERAAIFTGVGVNQGAFGLLCVTLIQAIAWLTGNFDKEGGLLFQPWANLLQLLVGVKPQTSRLGPYVSHAGGLPCGILGDEILTAGEGQIRALIVIGGNPLASAPDEAKLRRAFASLDLLVSVDIFQNQTGEMADALLPGTTWLERFDVGAWDAMYETAPMLQMSPRMRPPAGEARPEARIVAELSAAMGKPILKSGRLTRLYARLDWDGLLPRLLRPLSRLFRKRLQGADGLPWRAAKGGVYAGRRRKRLRFWRDDLDGEAGRLADFAAEIARLPEEGKFLLIGRRRRLAQNSWIHNAGREEKGREARAWLHPADMARLGLADGDVVEIQSEAGRIAMPAAAREGVTRGTAVVPHGLPAVNVNRLISSDRKYIEPPSGMHRMTGHQVTIRRAGLHSFDRL